MFSTRPPICDGAPESRATSSSHSARGSGATRGACAAIDPLLCWGGVSAAAPRRTSRESLSLSVGRSSSLHESDNGQRTTRLTVPSHVATQRPTHTTPAAADVRRRRSGPGCSPPPARRGPSAAPSKLMSGNCRSQSSRLRTGVYVASARPRQRARRRWRRRSRPRTAGCAVRPRRRRARARAGRRPAARRDRTRRCSRRRGPAREHVAEQRIGDVRPLAGRACRHRSVAGGRPIRPAKLDSGPSRSAFPRWRSTDPAGRGCSDSDSRLRFVRALAIHGRHAHGAHQSAVGDAVLADRRADLVADQHRGVRAVVGDALEIGRSGQPYARLDRRLC